ncbi:unnamed protein product, partial [Polarella glacialis]
MSCPAEIDLASITPEEDAKWRKCRWVWCKDCGGGSVCKVGWGHKKKAGHELVSLKDAGKLDEAKREFLFVQRGGNPAQEALTKAKKLSEAGKTRSSDLVEAPAQYLLDFGKYKGKSISAMLNSDDEKRKDYIPWLFASSSRQAQGQYLDKLEFALRQEGSWDQVVERSKAMRPGIQIDAVIKKAAVDALVAGGEFVHKDIVKMRSLQVDKATSLLDDDLAEGHSTSTGSQPLAIARTIARRPHRSSSAIENTHCKYCGRIGHRAPTCPK